MLQLKDSRPRLLHQTVPRPAIVALTLPAARDAPAFLTDITLFGFGHAAAIARTKRERKWMIGQQEAEQVDKVDTKEEVSLRFKRLSDIDLKYMFILLLIHFLAI
jgi:hypothetical protein